MRQKDFDNLTASIRQAGRIRRGEARPSRVQEFAPVDVKAKLIVPPDSLARELKGLDVRVYVFTPEMEHYLYVELFPEATGK